MISPADTLYMRRALELARMGELGASPNPMVGAVIVSTAGDVIGEGFHARCGGPHAEVRAMQAVHNRSLIPGSTVYVTLEPCAHYGKTPPCAAMLVRERVGRVVVGTVDPFAKVAGRGIAMLREAGIEVEVGVLEEECRRLNCKFFTAHTLKRPYVTLKWACSSDGWMDWERTPEHPGAASFSSELSRLEVMRLRAVNDAILVGSGTALADDPSLTVRGISGRQPMRVVLDRRGRVDTNARALADDGVRTLHITDPSVDLPALLHRLYAEGCISLLVEGGAELLQSFIKSGLWDAVRREMMMQPLGSQGRVAAPQLPRGVVTVEESDGRIVTHVANCVTQKLTFLTLPTAPNSDF